MRLLKMRENDHIALLTMHHIISDEWSLELFVGELVSLYTACINGEGAQLRELEAQYADFAVWQREWLQGEALERQLEYWRARLGRDLTAIQLPVDRTLSLARSYRGAKERVKIEEEVARKIYKISREQNATLFMVLLAAWQAMLWKYSGQEDVVVGTPIANRNRVEIEEIIGFFVNTLVIRTNLGGDPSFEELIKRVKEICLGAYAHQDLPFEKMVEELEPERDLGRNPLFQVMFAVQNRSAADLQMPGLSFSEVEVESAVAKFDLSLTMVEQGSGMSGVLEYGTDLFDQPTMGRMARHLVGLLEKIVDHSRERLSAISMLTEAERRQIAEWGRGERTSRIEGARIYELIERQAAARPDGVGVVSEDSHLSYEELNERSNQVAHYLLRQGVRPEARVGVMLERTPEMIIALVGILKAGGAYVPLDPAYPPNRLRYIIDDSQAEHVITQRSLEELLPEHVAKVVRIDAELEIWKQSRANPEVAMSPENLAYLIYTSGSTGKPKGVMIQHGTLVNFAQVAATEYGIISDDRILQFATISFDTSVEEIFPCLINGATLVLRHDSMLGAVATFIRNCRDLNLTILNLPTAYWHEVMAQMPDEVGKLAGTLRLVIIGSEKALPEKLGIWQKQIGACIKLINAYGPTEATVTSTRWELPKLTDRVALLREVPIGKPIPNVQVHLLDQYLQATPINIPGQLSVAGAGLARGYLNSPDLTAQFFIPHPSSDQPGARLYRTGDLARYSVDGEIEFIGRIDHQVKIRGYRIEPGEIETALAEYPGAQEAIVLACEGANDNKRLVAFITNKPGHEVGGAELRHFLKQRLPDYLIPSKFVVLEKLPLTPNGKIDRGALAALENREPQPGEEFVAPRDGIEQLLTQTWEGLLEVRNIGARANFFELGGHSLLATQVASRIREAFGIEIPLQSLFERPTVEGLAEEIRKRLRGAQGLEEPPITRASRDGELPLSFAQQRVWFMDQLVPGSALYNLPNAVRLKGYLRITALEQGLGEIRRRHEVLRTNFPSLGGEPIQVIMPAAFTPAQLIDLSGLNPQTRDHTARRLVHHEAQKAFDLGQDQLLRTRLICLQEQEYILLVTMHHIVSDGWSTEVMVNEFSTLYRAYQNGDRSPLAELAIQYADFSVWQRKRMEDKAFDGQLDYWVRELAGAPALDLPTELPRPATTSYVGAREIFALSGELTERLKEASRRQGVTLFMSLLASFQLLLARYAGQDRVAVGFPIAGRNRKETESLIGFFINTLVIVTDVSGNPTVRDLLHRVREKALGAYAHQEAPFERLVEELQPERSLNQHPLFQVMLVYQNYPMRMLEFPGLTSIPEPVCTDTANFDLTLTFLEEEGQLCGSLEYSSDLYERVNIQRLLGNFQQTLDGIAGNQESRVMDIPIMTEAERRQIAEWSGSERKYQVEQVCLPELIERQAAARPDSVSVVSEGSHLTYEELNRRSNQVAHYLLKLGVGPEARVGVMLERSSEMVIALLGVLKAGAAYVPLDPAYPTNRLRYVIDDSQAEHLLTQSSLTELLPEHEAKVVRIDGGLEIWNENRDNPEVTISTENLAYLIYTSGSTGRSKGVMVRHGSLVNAYRAWEEAYQLGSSATCHLQMASFAFDVSVGDMVRSLCSGGKLVLCPRDLLLDPEGLYALMLREKIDCAEFVPLVLKNLVAYVEETGRSLAFMRVLIAGSDLWYVGEYEKCLRYCGADTRLINSFGLTEATIDSSYFEGRELGLPVDRVAPIGRPFANTRIYLLDNRLQPVPIGVCAEIYVGGPGLARGYHQNPDLTAGKFIPDPFGDEGGARLYRTGDLARYLPDGEIEFIGRINHQVKIRGYRVEPGEIESVLMQSPAVRRCVVMAREVEPGDKRLIAYLVLGEDVTATIMELREFLRQRLPDYLTPSFFVILQSFPISPNGKVDRQALPIPSQSDLALESVFVAPRSPIEEELARIFGEVLGVERVGIHDNFFDLGGHSLLVTQVVSRINRAFQIEISLRDLFDAPTVSGISTVIVQSQIRQAEGEAFSQMLADLEGLSEAEIELELSKW
jgi:amino acid adenylation domain-containing protein